MRLQGAATLVLAAAATLLICSNVARSRYSHGVTATIAARAASAANAMAAAGAAITPDALLDVMSTREEPHDETSNAVAGFRAFVASERALFEKGRASQPPPPSLSPSPSPQSSLPQPATASPSAAASPPPPSLSRSVAPPTRCNRDHSSPLSIDDVLCRVPRGEVAFTTLANGAYGELGAPPPRMP